MVLWHSLICDGRFNGVMGRIQKQPLCICKGKAAYNIPPPYLRIAKSLRAMGYEVFRFNGVEFLLNMKGKTVVFVGDSLGRNQWQSLICMLPAAAPQAQTQLVRGNPLSLQILGESNQIFLSSK